MNSRTYPGIDVIRLSAALMVAGYHMGWWLWRFEPTPPPLTPFVFYGWVGVPIFFVISGFVIAMSAHGRDAPSFVKSRAARLYPASWICASIIMLARPLPLSIYLRTLILFPVGPWVSGVYWTLAVEIVFYSLVAFALWRKWDLARVALSLGCYSSAFWFLRGINSFFGKPIDFNMIENDTGFLLLAHDGMFFAFGMLLYSRRYPLAALAFLASGLLAVTVRSHAISTAGPFYVAPLVWLAATAFIVLVVFDNRRISKAISWLPTRFLGLMTYPLYLIHLQIGRLITLQFLDNRPMAFVASVGGAVALAVAIVPLEARLRRLVFGQVRDPGKAP